MKKIREDDRTQEHQLVLDLIAGSEVAFCKLYALYKERVIAFSARFTKSREIAEDIYQDTFAQLWVTREQIDANKKFSTYIFTIVKNKLIDSLRKQFRDNEFREKIVTEADYIVESTLDGILATDFHTIYTEALDKLTPQQRKVFAMSREEHKSHKEIANQLEVSIDTIKKHITNTLSVIREHINKHLE